MAIQEDLYNDDEYYEYLSAELEDDEEDREPDSAHDGESPEYFERIEEENLRAFEDMVAPPRQP